MTRPFGRHLRLAGWLLLGLLAAAPQRAQGETYPSHPIRFVVPFTPGGTTDILARVLGQGLGEALGQQFVVDNRPGAGGAIGSEAVARAAPDGYTLLMGHIGTLAVNPGLYTHLGYDPIKSFQPITLVAIVPNILVVHPSIPVDSVKALIDYARTHPGKLTYGSGGNGSAAHIAMAAFVEATGTAMIHVPYRGTAPMVNDLLAGQIALTMTGGPAVLPQVRNNALRALGVSSLQRLPSEPDIPTIAEAALPGFEATQWYGVVAPTGTPAEIVDRLNREIHRLLAAPDIVARLRGEGAFPSPGTPQEFGALIASEIDRWGSLIRRTNIQPD